ncbi:MAG: hypothetical protein IPG69_04845 [Flavobacteriales bacterium]|nr:hypothetical protein [Flavobacteriales bacterium]
MFHGSAVGPMDCPANDSIVVTVVDPPDPHILSSLQFCEGDSTGDILADMPGDYGGVASGSATELGTVQPIQLATGSHAFSFTVTDTNSCVTVLTESIEVVEVPDVTLTLPFGEFFPSARPQSPLLVGYRWEDSTALRTMVFPIPQVSLTHSSMESIRC